MPPQLALIICSIFVLLLLRLENKQAPEISFALWIPTLWMLMITSKPLGIWFGSVGAGMEEGSAIDRVVLSTLLCLGFIILAGRKFNLSSIIKKNACVMLLIGFMLVSILWSDMPYVSFKRWIRELIAVVMAMVVATEPEPRQALQSIFRRIVYVLIPFSYILIHYFPQYGRGYGHWSGAQMWTGVASQKNGLALLCLFSAFFLVWTLIRRWQGRDKPVVRYQVPLEVFLLFLTIWLFMGPQHTLKHSATSTVALAFGLTTFVGLSWMKKRGKLIGSSTLMLLVLFIIIYGTITPFIGGLTLYDASSALGRGQTLTGRSEIWAFLVPIAMQKSILGHGFGGFWTSAMSEAAKGPAHNGYLDIILNLGFVGLILFSMFLLSCCRRFQKTLLHDFDWGVFGICFLLMGVVHNIAETSIYGFTGSFPAIILFLAVSFTTVISRFTSEYRNGILEGGQPIQRPNEHISA